MNYYELEDLYNKLKEIIDRLNNPIFTNLNQIISWDLRKAADNSFETWYKSIPSDLIKEIYHVDDAQNDQIKDDFQTNYSVPYLHLKNNDWVKALISKNKSEHKRLVFLSKNIDLINKLAQQLTIALSYVGLDNLSEKQRQLLKTATNFIEKNESIIQSAKYELDTWDEVDPKVTVNSESMWENKQFYAKYFHQTKVANDLMIMIEKKSSELSQELESVSIKKIQDKVKKIWQELKQINYDKQLWIKNNPTILNFFSASEQNYLANFDNLADFVREAKSQIFLPKGFSDIEFEEMKNKAIRLMNSLKSSSYPRLESESLTHTEFHLLALIKQYKEYPLDRDQQVGEVIKQLENLENDIATLNELASTRYEANFLNNQKYNFWINLEQHIYSSFLSILNNVRNIKPAPREEKKDEKIRRDFQNKSASYIAEIENITGESDSIENTSSLPQLVIDEVNKHKLNLSNLKATLRPYQIFAGKYILTFKKVLLGDEMGLGKTLEALSVANHLYQLGKKHTLAVGPLSVLTNWKQEVKTKTKLPPYIFHGHSGANNLLEWKEYGGVLITNYEQCSKILELDPHLTIDLMIVDEAHNIKHSSAQRTQSAKALLANSEYKLLMTGTPLENNLSEMNSLISLLRPALGKHLQNNLFMGKKEYKNSIATVYLRRKRIDVLKELPLINMVQSWSKFNEDQQDFYDAAINEGINGFQKMRRAAFIGKNSEKIDQIQHICEDARSNGEKVLIFSFFKEDVVYKLQNILPFVARKPITGDITSSQERQKIIDEFSSSPNESVLICQINAAGLGLNIQSASQVIICEPQMKPSTENQAISRAYRMGQTKNVTVYHLLTENSIDETIITRLDYKQRLFDKYANDSIAADMLGHTKENKKSRDNSTSIKKEIFNVEKRRLNQRKLAMTEQ